MFAGKTEELLRRVRRAAIARRPVQVFTHVLDQRGSGAGVVSHSGLAFPSSTVASAAELEAAINPETSLVAIDEAQFFGPELIPLAERLAKRGADVIIGGLDVTYDGEPFAPLPALMALAERVDKLTAICTVCGADAVYHQRVDQPATASSALVPEHVGGLDKYEARCRAHFHSGHPRAPAAAPTVV
jgi:thymidine kinase